MSLQRPDREPGHHDRVGHVGGGRGPAGCGGADPGRGGVLLQTERVVAVTACRRKTGALNEHNHVSFSPRRQQQGLHLQCAELLMPNKIDVSIIAVWAACVTAASAIAACLTAAYVTAASAVTAASEIAAFDV